VPSVHGGWSARDLGVALPDTPVSLLERSVGEAPEVWASTMSSGIFKFAWKDYANAEATEKRYGLRLKSAYRPGSGLPAGVGACRWFRSASTCMRLTDSGILELQPDSKFGQAAELANYVGIAAASSTADTSIGW